MKTQKQLTPLLLKGLVAAVFGLLSISSVHAQNLYVTNYHDATVGEYDAVTGATINASLVNDATVGTEGVAVVGNVLYVETYDDGNIGSYDATTGAAINSTLIPNQNAIGALAVANNQIYVAGFTQAINEYDGTTGAATNTPLVANTGDSNLGIAISGNDLFVSDFYSNAIGEFDVTTGAAINASLVSSGLSAPRGIAVSGNDLFVVNQNSGTVGEYDATTGAEINASLVSGLNQPGSIAVFSNDLYIGDAEGTVGEYDATTGAAINASLVYTGDVIYGVAVVATPEPSTWTLLLVGLGALVYLRRRQTARAAQV